MPDDSEPQPVLGLLSDAAVFLVVTMKAGAEADNAMRSIGVDIGALVRAVGFRALDGALSCVTAFGSDAWDRIVGPSRAESRPAGLHRFVEISSAGRNAPSTDGDLLFHIRASRFDLCIELAAQILTRLGPTVMSADEVHGFRYFESRDLLGFVDGTENPTGQSRADAVLIGDEDAAYAGGSYVIVQKYLHDLDAWNDLPVEVQEKIIGRTKLSDIELDDAVKPTSAHNALTTIVVDGEEVQILRDNMPFANAAAGEFGTYFIGYARGPGVIEQMLTNMFVGLPEGNYDRILDFSTAVTGILFFVPAQPMLESLATISAATGAVPSASAATTESDGSLGIGDLR